MTSITYRKGGLVARDLGRGLSISFVGFIAVIVLVFAAIGVGVHLAGGNDGTTWDSMWENSAYATRYFPLAMGIMIAPAYLPVALANGVTRRSFGVGATILVVAIAALMAVLEAAGYAVEFGLYRLGGAEQAFSVPHLFDSGIDVPSVIGEVWLLVAVHVAVGYLIGVTYYLKRWRWGTLLLPVVLVPLLAVEALMSVGWAGAVMTGPIGVERLPLVIVIPAVVLIIAATVWTTHVLIRRADVRPPAS